MKRYKRERITLPGFINAGYVKDLKKGTTTMIQWDDTKYFKTPFSPRRNGKCWRGMTIKQVKDFYGIRDIRTKTK